ncbi:hypothetical protein Ahy_B06g083200 [Arachis hypogaea]|uniref:Aminotransferase-like plant mobile domain-containing protein n=1 Tax=Arachis hypogaea TaxID=3818 RepID=A0A444YPE7_ARAHY|nr:hypothetical protein Ahy_B06g083200 [Arachis hypogaea]
MQLWLLLDGKPVSELLGDVPPGHVGIKKFNIKLKWLKIRLQQMPLDAPDNARMQYACCYIMYLLGGILLPNKANNTVYIRYLMLLANYDAISTYSWSSTVLCCLYRAICLATDYNVEGMTGCHTLLMSWIYYRLSFWAPNVTMPYTFSIATRWRGRKDKMTMLATPAQALPEFNWLLYMDPRILLRVSAEFLGAPQGDFYTAVVPLILFRWIEILNVDRVLR